MRELQVHVNSEHTSDRCSIFPELHHIHPPSCIAYPLPLFSSYSSSSSPTVPPFTPPLQLQSATSFPLTPYSNQSSNIFPSPFLPSPSILPSLILLSQIFPPPSNFPPPSTYLRALDVVVQIVSKRVDEVDSFITRSVILEMTREQHWRVNNKQLMVTKAIRRGSYHVSTHQR